MPPERWLVLTVSIPPAPPSARELLPPGLLELGARGVEEKDGAFVVYLPPPPEEPEAFLARIRPQLEELAGAGPLEMGWHWQAQEDWDALWRRGLGPRRITSRLIVAPSWDTPEVQPEEILITLDPGMAFGTAEHATTRGCLRLLDGLVRRGDRLADVGAGSAILSIAAAHLGAAEVVGVEMDPLACEAALENVKANGVTDRVRIIEAQVGEGDLLPGGPFHGLVANIQRLLLLPLLPIFRGNLLPEGWLILSGILLEEREEILSAAGENGFSLLDEDREGEWWSGVFRSP